MIVDDTVLGLAFGFGMLLLWMLSVEYGAWRERRRPPTQLARHLDGPPLIPPGTKTHVFTDIPDDDLLTPREGHPYT